MDDARALPLQVGTVYSSCELKGPSLSERVLGRRKKRHEEVVEEMRKKFKEVNDDAGREVWKKSKILEAQLIKMKQDMEELLDKSVRSYSENLTEMKTEVLESARKSILNHDKERSSMIDVFYEDLKKVEENRSVSFKQILNESYRRTQQTYHMLPRDLLELFEYEILNINEMTMNNYFNYLNLYTDLKIQTEEYLRTLLLEMKEVEFEHKIALKKLEVRGLVDMNFLDYDFLFAAEEPASEVPAKCSATGSLRRETYALEPVPAADVEAWTRRIKETLDILNSNARKLVDLYKMAVGNIFNRFFHELEKITDMLVEEESLGSFADNYYQTEVYKPVIDDMTQQYTCEFADLQKLWNTITDYMQSNIKNTFSFLNGSAHLWDEHFARIDQSQALIFRDLQNVIGKNDKASLNFEKKLNKTLDRLRQASTLAKLDRHLKETERFLDSIGNM